MPAASPAGPAPTMRTSKTDMKRSWHRRMHRMPNADTNRPTHCAFCDDRRDFGRYSISTLLTMATGRPGITTVSCPAGVRASSDSPSRLTWLTAAGSRDEDLFASRGRDRLQAARAGAAADAIKEVGRAPELRLHGGTLDQVPFHAQHANHRVVLRVAFAALGLRFGVRVARVQIERQRRLARVRRNRYHDAQRRIGAGRHVAEATDRLRAHPDQRRTANLRRRRLGDGRRGFGRRFLHRRFPLLRPAQPDVVVRATAAISANSQPTRLMPSV